MADGPVAFIMHHTAGGGDPEGVVNFWRQQGRGYGSQYIMDRNGVVHDVAKEFGYTGRNQILNGTGVGKGLNNGNVVGMEIIAKNDADVTDAQKQSAAQFVQANYPKLPVYGHGQVNTGHKEATEGLGAVNAVMALRKNPDAADTASAYANPSPTAPAVDAINKSAVPVGNMTHEQFIRDYAQKIGVNPDLAVGVANAEGLRAWSKANPNAGSYVDRTSGVPWSFGDFQLNTRNGMGVDALKAGVDPRDPNQWQAADKFALDQMKAGGLSPWKGDAFAASWMKSGRPITGTTLTSTPAVATATEPGIGSGYPTPAQPNPTAVAAETPPPAAPQNAGDWVKKFVDRPPPTKDAQGNEVQGKSPLEKLTGAIPGKPAGQQAAAPEPAPFVPVQDPMGQMAGPAGQLFTQALAASAKPLTWSSKPYGWDAGQQMVPGMTLNSMGQG